MRESLKVAFILSIASCATAGRSSPVVPPKRSAAPTAEQVRVCTGFALPLVAVPEKPRDDERPAGPNVAWSLVFAPAANPTLELITVALYRGRSTYGAAFPSPSEGPTSEPGPAGRPITREARSFFLGGAIVWATLPSPDGATDLTVAVNQVPHDSGIAPDEFEALRAIDAVKALVCLDAALQ